VSYRIRLFVPPAEQAGCYTSQFANPPYKSFWWQDATIPVPPLSLNAGPGEGLGKPGYMTQFSYVCSAGTMASIDLFMQTELTRLGYHTGTLPCFSGPFWIKGSKGISWSGPTPTYWTLTSVVCL